MHLGQRDARGHRRTRTVVWADGSETDLGVLVAASIAVVICAFSIAAAISFGGSAKAITVVLAVLSGLYATVLGIPLLLAGPTYRWLRRRFLDDRQG